MEFRVSPHQLAMFGEVPVSLAPRADEPPAEGAEIAASGFRRSEPFGTGIVKGVIETPPPCPVDFDGGLEVESGKLLFILAELQFGTGFAGTL